MRVGFRVPRGAIDSETDAPAVGEFFPAIFFARDPRNAAYGPVLLRVKLSGEFVAWRARRGETLADTLHRLIGKAKMGRYDGVTGPSDTVGIAVTNPEAVESWEIEEQ